MPTQPKYGATFNGVAPFRIQKQTMEEKNLQSLQKLLSVLDTEALTPDMFVKYFEEVIAFVKGTRDLNETERENLKNLFELAQKELKSGNAEQLTSLKEEISSTLTSELSKIKKETNATLSEIQKKTDLLKNGDDADEEIIVGKVLERLPPPKEVDEETPEQTRDKLETLEGEERLDISAIKGFENVKKDEGGKLQLVGGTAGIKLYVGGVKKGTAKTLNLIAGSGVSLTYATANGRNDITISASGASLSILTSTGTIDNSNKAFTFVSKPNVVIVNGASYRENNGWTWTGGTLTATLDNAVGVGGDIYAL